MASTNKTTNYDLSQFIGTDKPTFLGDYNGDMAKIDAQMKVNADNVATANTNASSAVSTANTANTNANSALSSATSATNTANTANTNANTALGLANANAQAIANINLTSFTTINTFTKVGSGTLRSNSQINTALNVDGSLAKIYGQITIENVTNTTTNQGSISFSTSLRPSTSITIVGGAIGISSSTQGVVQTVYAKDYTIGIDGTITMTYDNSNVNNAIVRFIFINSLIFVKDFGDTPIGE